ncbi:hypothetical protein HJFPF1_07609 [Paramyrothecium foliicola]|nr:hypothetical protein HJFPF1_07609 [Paramyrothecium foliicola]
MGREDSIEVGIVMVVVVGRRRLAAVVAQRVDLGLEKNRVVLVDLPGIVVREEWKKKAGRDKDRIDWGREG